MIAINPLLRQEALVAFPYKQTFSFLERKGHKKKPAATASYQMLERANVYSRRTSKMLDTQCRTEEQERGQVRLRLSKSPIEEAMGERYNR